MKPDYYYKSVNSHFDLQSIQPHSTITAVLNSNLIEFIAKFITLADGCFNQTFDMYRKTNGY